MERNEHISCVILHSNFTTQGRSDEIPDLVSSVCPSHN